MAVHLDRSTDLVAAARGFIPMLRDRANEIEAARRLPQDIADDFAKAGLYALCIPETYGGLEASPTTMLEVIETLATGDGAAGWCVFIGATSNLMSAYLPKETAQAIYGANPAIISAGVFAPRGIAVPEDDGYRVNGQWQWGSGTQNASWILGGCVVVNDGQPELMPNGIPLSRMMLVPSAEVEFLDTWHVSGLCGTGSTDFAMHNVFVPKDRAVSLVTDRPLQRPLYAFPVFGMLAIGISAVALGLARAALDELVGVAGAKTPDGSRRNLASKQNTQREIAEAEATLRSARLFLYDSVARAYDAAQASGRLTVDHRRDIRLSAAHACRASAQAVDTAYNLAGGTSVYRSSPLQRHFRDVHTATQHMMVGPAVWELTGRLFLGLETDASLL